jgi:hypothetical protein
MLKFGLMNLTDVKVLARPYQSESLQEIFKFVCPNKRLAVAAVILGVSVLDILIAAGFEKRNAWHYMYERKLPGLNSEIMRRIAEVLDVPIFCLWDNEAIEKPMSVIQTKTRVLNVADSRKKTKRAKYDEQGNSNNPKLNGHSLPDGLTRIRG